MAAAVLHLGPGNFLDGQDIHVIALGPSQLLVSIPQEVGLERDHVLVEAGGALGRLSGWRVARLFYRSAGGDAAAELDLTGDGW